MGSCSPDEVTTAAHKVMPAIKSYADALKWLRKIVRFLLASNRKLDAALLLFGTDLFDPLLSEGCLMPSNGIRR